MTQPPPTRPLEQVRRGLVGLTKMRAIMMYRGETGIGWAAAAEAVERIQSGGPPKPVEPPKAAARPPAPAAEFRVVERATFRPVAVLLFLAALSGAVFGLVYLFTARN